MNKVNEKVKNIRPKMTKLDVNELIESFMLFNMFIFNFAPS